jgi:lactate permease
MTWNMVQDPAGNVALSALLAAVPLFFLFWALAVKRMKGHITAMGAVAIGVAVAIAGFHMPAKLAVLATVDGMLFGLWPVAWIVVTAVFLYNMSVKTGQFEVLKNSLASITDDRRLQALLIAFSFGAFLEGAAGFGAPVAISGAMLVGLGFQRASASSPTPRRSPSAPSASRSSSPARSRASTRTPSPPWSAARCPSSRSPSPSTSWC